MPAEAMQVTTMTYRPRPLPSAPPAHLTPAAADAWRELAGLMPWLTRDDEVMLEGVAELATRQGQGPEWRALYNEALDLMMPAAGTA
jgi:hypothetical protein